MYRNIPEHSKLSFLGWNTGLVSTVSFAGWPGALQTLQRGWASTWDEALWELETLSDSFRIVTRLLCGGENRKPEHPLKGIRRSSLGSSGELEPLRTGNQPTFFLGLWHAPDTLTAISLIAGEILAYGVVKSVQNAAQERTLQQSKMTRIKSSIVYRGNHECFPFYLLFWIVHALVHRLCQRQNIIYKVLFFSLPPQTSGCLESHR